MAAEEEVKIVLSAEETATREIKRLQDKLEQFRSRMKQAFSTPISNGLFDDKKIQRGWAEYGKGMREATEGHVRYARDLMRAGKLTADTYAQQERAVRRALKAANDGEAGAKAHYVEQMQRLRGMQYAWNREHERFLQQKRRETAISDQVSRAQDRLARLGFIEGTRRRMAMDALDRQRSRAYMSDLNATAKAQTWHENYVARMKRNSFQQEMRQREALARADARQQREAQQSAGRAWGGVKGAAGSTRDAAQTTAIVSAVALAGIEKIAERGINSRMRIESAEANLRMFGNFSQAQVDQTRRGWLDRTAVEKGFSPSSAINAFTEVIKAGIPEASAKAVTQSIMGASAGLDLNVADTTKLVGRLSTLTQNPNNFKPDAITEMLNGIAVVAKVTAADSNEIVSSLRRGAGVLGSTKMSVQDLTAFTGVGISAGMQEGKAGTFMDFLANDLVNAKNSRGQRRADLQQGLRLAGLGGVSGVSRQAANDPTALLLKLFENMAKMNPQKAGQVASLIGMREWRGEMLMMAKAAPMLRQTVEAERDPRNATHLQDAQDIQLGTLRGMIRQINATAELLWEAVGKGLEAPFREIGRFFLNFGKEFDPKIITDYVSVLVEGFTSGLGFSSIPEMLEAIFGKPGELNTNNLGKWFLFAKGLGEGIRSIIDAIKRMLPEGGFDPKQLGVWAGQIGAFATALTALGPALSVLGSLAGIVTGIGGAVIATAAAWPLITAFTGGAGAAAGGGAGIAASIAAGGAAAGAAAIPVSLVFIGSAALAALGMWASYKLGGTDGVKGATLGLPSGDGGLTERDKNLKSLAEELGGIAGRSATQGGIRAPDGTPGQRQSYERRSSLDGLIHNASYRAFDDRDDGSRRIVESVSDLKSMIQLAALTTGAGIPGIGGASVTGGGGGGGGGIGGKFFTPDGMQVPGWFGQGRGGPAKYGMGGQTFGQKAPGIMKNLMSDFNLTKEQAAGIVANLGHESAGFTAYQEKNPLGGGRGGAGWAQWTGPRRRQFEAWAKANNLDPRSDAASYGFLKHELTGSEAGALAAVRRQNSAGGAMVAFENHFERAGVKNWGSRQRYLNQAMGLNPDSASVNAAADPAGALGGGGDGSKVGNAVDIAEKYLGKDEHKNRKELSGFVGHDVVGTMNAWCARFVNSSLAAAGVKGTGSAMANSFLRWGQAVDAEAVKKGDVAVEHRNKGVNAGGGHVGLATGRKRINPQTGELEIETVSGNHGDAVVKDWTAASKLAIRRSTDAAATAAIASVKEVGANAAKAQNGGNPGSTPGAGGRIDVGRGISGVPFGQKPTTDEVVQNTPSGGGRFNGGVGGGGGGGKGGGGNTYHIKQEINGVTSPQEVANAAQRKMTEDWNHRTHDLEPELT